MLNDLPIATLLGHEGLCVCLGGSVLEARALILSHAACASSYQYPVLFNILILLLTTPCLL
jgi:hypothetical protein